MCIVDGIFDLVDYSENLDFTLIRLSSPLSSTSPLWQFAMILVVVILLVLVVFLAYRNSKKKKSGRPKTNSNNFLKILFNFESKKGGVYFGF
jgi:hypothetical protein